MSNKVVTGPIQFSTAILSLSHFKRKTTSGKI